MRARAVWLIFSAHVLGLTAVTPAMAYGYAEAEDPVVAIFRDGVSSARKGDFHQAAAKARQGLELIKSHKHSGAALAPKINQARSDKAASVMAEILANIVYLSLKEKLEANISGKAQNYKQSKARLFLARKNYMDVLQGNLMKNNPAQDKLVMESFGQALAALGNPGLFGLGQKPADPAAFSRAARDIERAIEQYYSRFVKQ